MCDIRGATNDCKVEMGDQLLQGAIDRAAKRNQKYEGTDREKQQQQQLEELRRSDCDCLKESGEYAIDLTLSNNGVDRNVYHGKCLIAPHIQKLLDRRVKVLKELETEFLALRARTIVKHPGADCASIKTIREEMTFFSEVLHCYDTCFAILRRTQTIYTIAEVSELQGAIDKLTILWPTQRSWEQKWHQ
jgi:hypothetical protein